MNLVVMAVAVLVTSVLAKYATAALARAAWRMVTGFRFRSTPTHLVIEREARPTTDWRRVRELEWGLEGRYYTGLDGQQLADDDPAAYAPDDDAIRADHQELRDAMSGYGKSNDVRRSILDSRTVRKYGG